MSATAPCPGAGLAWQRNHLTGAPVCPHCRRTQVDILGARRARTQWYRYDDPVVPHDGPSMTRTARWRRAANIPETVTLTDLRDGHTWRTRIGSAALVEHDGDVWQWELCAVTLSHPDDPWGPHYDDISVPDDEDFDPADWSAEIRPVDTGTAPFLHQALRALCWADLVEWWQTVDAHDGEFPDDPQQALTVDLNDAAAHAAWTETTFRARRRWCRAQLTAWGSLPTIPLSPLPVEVDA